MSIPPPVARSGGHGGERTGRAGAVSGAATCALCSMLGSDESCPLSAETPRGHRAGWKSEGPTRH